MTLRDMTGLINRRIPQCLHISDNIIIIYPLAAGGQLADGFHSPTGLLYTKQRKNKLWVIGAGET